MKRPEDMSLQEMFDFVCKKIIEQGNKSVNSKYECLYRGPDGLKCAAGWLIPDDEYDPEIEGYGVHALRSRQLAFVLMSYDQVSLLEDLQKSHDGDDLERVRDLDFVGVFKQRAAGVARDWDLDQSVLD